MDQVSRNNRIYAETRKRYESRYKTNDDKHRLNYFQEIKCPYKKPESECFNNRDFFITPKDYSGVGLTSRCIPLSESNNGGCIVDTHYRGKSMTYVFRRNQLHRWEEIDSGIRSFLDGFLIEESINDKILYTGKQGEK